MMSVGLGELLILFGVCAITLVPIALVLLLVRGTIRQTKMGINLEPPKACPRCGEPLPMIRAPKSFKQAMWGGWTCSKCNTELDKWGRVIS